MTSPTDISAIDHFVLAGPDLEALVEVWSTATGIVPTPGGAHDGVGTRNELVAVDSTTYIELIGPDAAQPEPQMPRPFGIDRLKAPGLITFAMAVDSVDEASRAIAATNTIEPGPPLSMQRLRPDGVMLAWRLLVPPDPGLAGVMPFFIEWGDTPHPAASLADAASIGGLTLTHPRAGDIAAAVRAATGTNLAVSEGDPSLRVTFSGPDGELHL